MTSSFEQIGAPLVGAAQPPSSLAAAVAAGELWMEAGVAESAAARCDRAVREINDLLRDARDVIRKREFGGNEDGNRVAERFAQAGQDYIDAMKNAQKVFANMAVTYRVAGRTVAEIDVANERMFRGWSE